MKFFERFKRFAAIDLANQFAIPVRSLPGWYLSRSSSRHNIPLYKTCMNALPLQPNNFVLEVGYGRGKLLELCHSFIRKNRGNGIVFGVERAQYMEELARKKFALEMVEEGSIQLNRVLDLRHLPYPNDTFHGIFHIDVFYFWRDERMLEICREFFRVIRPGHKIVCAMEFDRLKRLENWGLLQTNQWDPMRYLSYLEPAGFIEAKLEYVNQGDRRIQLLVARKPDAEVGYFDPEERMKNLETEVKRQMLLDDMMKNGYKPNTEELLLLQDKKLFR